ncbi:hypothetical protein [Geoalkalibacter halelectricus]|uniref:hypothetical protein n=1 Tax=Geoalkalibacter halelectricus TaxID=2847045 RepID=UPI0034612009
MAVVSALLDEAAAKGAKLALLPEMFAFFHPDDNRKRHFAEALARQVVRRQPPRRPARPRLCRGARAPGGPAVFGRPGPASRSDPHRRILAFAG